MPDLGDVSPRAKNRKGAVQQVTEWLKECFPTAYPVEVRLVPHIPLERQDKRWARAHEIRMGYDGMTERKGRQFLIRIAMAANTPREDVVETLLHEWSHCRTWKHEAIERTRVHMSPHDAAYWVEFGDIYRAFYDEQGFRDAWGY